MFLGALDTALDRFKNVRERTKKDGFKPRDIVKGLLGKEIMSFEDKMVEVCSGPAETVKNALHGKWEKERQEEEKKDDASGTNDIKKSIKRLESEDGLLFYDERGKETKVLKD